MRVEILSTGSDASPWRYRFSEVIDVKPTSDNLKKPGTFVHGRLFELTQMTIAQRFNAGTMASTPDRVPLRDERRPRLAFANRSRFFRPWWDLLFSSDRDPALKRWAIVSRKKRQRQAMFNSGTRATRHICPCFSNPSRPRTYRFHRRIKGSRTFRENVPT